VRFYVELIGCEEVFRFEDAYVGLAGGGPDRNEIFLGAQ